ncbi:GNAT family N-acetyltransferase [Myxosarcina sp. GI1]|uniref:GNAT family N-acetyltransferase n=1 Tax=Myxosarcina sp. GI1 TaxID=1541065 RepID=UPI00055CBD48|nr:GNAT family N-acetyltransferase [Myxosarcina sp. GI1]
MAIAIETPRLILRYFTPDDTDALTAILSDPKVMQYSISGTKTRSQTQEFIAWILSSYQKYGFGLYAVTEKETKQLIGYCGLLVWYFEEITEIELGYRLATAYWNKGLATEAATAVRNYAWQQLKLNRLICLIQPENLRSIRVANKLAMKPEKNLILHELNVKVYSIYQNLDNKI